MAASASIDASAALARPGVHAVITAAEIGAVIPTIPLRQESSPAFKPFEQPVHRARQGALCRRAGRGRAGGERRGGRGRARGDRARHRAAAGGRGPRRRRDERRPAVRDGRQQSRRSRSPACAATPTPRSRRAAYVRRERFKVQRHGAVPMEPRGLLAEWDAARGRLTVSGAAKVAFPNRRMLAKQMGLPESVDPHGRERRRRRLRRARRILSGGFPDPVRGAPDRPAGEMDRGSPRASPRHQSCPRRRMRARDRLRRATARSWRCAATPSTDQGAYIRTNRRDAARNIAQVLTGPYRIPHVRIDVVADDDQQDAVRDLSRARALRGRFLSRAAVRHRGAASLASIASSSGAAI